MTVNVKSSGSTNIVSDDCANKPGIYSICNVVTGVVYIGSSRRLRTRVFEHILLLRKGRHHNAYLQAAWLKYGEVSFACSPLEYVEKDRLIEAEQGAIDSCGLKVYNLRKTASSNIGMRHDEDTKAAIGAAIKSSWKRDEYRERIISIRLGKPMSEQTKEKISRSHIGKKLSPEHRQAMSNAVRKKLPARTQEHSAKIAETKAKCYEVTSPDGSIQTIKNLRRFCRENGLDHASMGRVAKGTQHTSKGWFCRFAENDKGLNDE